MFRTSLSLVFEGRDTVVLSCHGVSSIAPVVRTPVDPFTFGSEKTSPWLIVICTKRILGAPSKAASSLQVRSLSVVATTVHNVNREFSFLNSKTNGLSVHEMVLECFRFASKTPIPHFRRPRLRIQRDLKSVLIATLIVAGWCAFVVGIRMTRFTRRNASCTQEKLRLGSAATQAMKNGIKPLGW